MNTPTTEPRPGTPVFDALLPLCRRDNPFARVAMCHFEHGRALADAFIASNHTMREVYACIRLLRRYGHLPEGCYLDGYFFDAWTADRREPLDDYDLEELRVLAWELRDTLTELSVSLANVA